jgi:hypothetical protein
MEAWEEESALLGIKRTKGIVKDVREKLENRQLVKRLNLSQKTGKIEYWEFDLQAEGRGFESD